MQPRLTRTKTDRMIAGVCGGLGHYFGVDPVIVRLIFVVLAITTFVTPLIYPVLWLIMPAAQRGVPQAPQTPTGRSLPPDARFDPMTGEPLPARAPTALPPHTSSIQETQPAPIPGAVPSGRGRVLGMALLAIGGIILINNVGDALSRIFGVDLSGIVFPLLLVAVGVFLLRYKAA